MTFIDEVEIRVEAGKGGDGRVSFHREKFVAKGGPDGGDGGNGGSVILLAQEGVDSLMALAHSKLWKAKDGEQGGTSQCTGRSTEDLILLVPPGTVVRDAKHGHIIKDLGAANERVVVAQGGKGGKGNLHFKSSTNRAPRQHTLGDPGEARTLRLELKVIADVGLIGKPNAGKSTLLSRLSPRSTRNCGLSVYDQVSVSRPRADRLRPVVHHGRYSRLDRRCFGRRGTGT